MRDNLIKHHSKIDLQDVLGLIGCTCRIRGAFNSDFITRENDGEPQVDERFYQRFMSLDGWGLLEKFWTEYPELVEGMDRSVLIQEEHLIPP